MLALLVALFVAAPASADVVVVASPGASADAALRVERVLADDGIAIAGTREDRAALRGEPSERPIAASHAALTGHESEDIPRLVAIARRLRARAVVVVRNDPEGPIARVLHVERRAFYEGKLTLAAASDLRIARFVRARGGSTPPPERASPDPAAPSTPPESTSFLEDAWPYLVVGALLVAGTTYVVLSEPPDEAPLPVLRFQSGRDE